MPEPSSSLDAMDITLQLAAAFGQGAGIMLIEADALRPAYNAYCDHFTRALPFWEEDALPSISVMRAMGAYAAHQALADGRFVIGKGDVESALRIVTRRHAMPLGFCRITGR
jgi:hypothetical protein